MTLGWEYKYGGWNRPRGIIYTHLVAVKVYVNGIDGILATVAVACHTV